MNSDFIHVAETDAVVRGAEIANVLGSDWVNQCFFTLSTLAQSPGLFRSVP